MEIPGVALVKVSQSSEEFETRLVPLLPMRYRPIVFSLLAAGSFLSSSQAQTGDWLAVQAIPPGSYISVKSQRYTVRCFFLTATDTQLLCEEHSLRKYPSGDPVVSDVNLDRQGISQVRLEHPTRSAFLGAVICTAIGAGIASALANGPKRTRKLRCTIQSFLGLSQDISEARFTGRISILHGKVVYRH